MTRDEANEELKCAIDLIKQNGKDWVDERDIPVFQMAIEALEQKSGKWYSYTRFHMNNWEGGYGCTCCKEWSAKESNYCPNCGAYMREGSEE